MPFLSRYCITVFEIDAIFMPLVGYNKAIKSYAFLQYSIYYLLYLENKILKPNQTQHACRYP